MELEYLPRVEGHLLELEPYRVDVVTRQASGKAKAGGVETSQGLVTQLATEAEGEEGETLTPSDCKQPLAIEETSDLEVRLSDSPGEESARQEEFTQEVLADPSLEELRQMAQESETEFTPEKREQVVWDKGLLYRSWIPKNLAETWEPCCQLIVPRKFRQQLLSSAHDLPCAGHVGRERTCQRLQVNFSWPRIAQNVTAYCKSCETCQRTGKSGDKQRAPLQPLPIIEQPSYKVGIDIVGPRRHRTRRGKKCILTLVDFATRYPVAVALTSTEAPVVANAPTKIFFQLGFPSEILTDRGGNFMAEAQEKQSVWYDKKAGSRTFERGDKVMVFLPLKTDKLRVAWEGPWLILDRLDNMTYVGSKSGSCKKPKVVHVNMLKPYIDRGETVFWVSPADSSPEDLEEPVMHGDWDGEAGIEELRLPDHLPSQDKDKLLTILKDYETVFSNKPGKTNLAMHTIDTGSHRPTQSRPYAVNARQAGLTMKAKKCQLAIPDVIYLGHHVGRGHIAPLWDKIEAIRDWPPPQTKKQVRAFLGLAGYYRRFVPGFGATAAPLHELTKKGSPDPVTWKQECQEAFDTLKAALIKQPILKAPVHEKRFTVATDASDTGLGAVLLQEHEGNQHPVVT
ncbi:hypothetical protein Y1Q_0004434 [Alligator mississippiensis]|uniref:Gypsy retrotransposon integrase-like protein 1 n=1 Tax=Alligator mississippiensis TaxID=8496 RepID=A0A151NU13_ALLMI|nr:hypothetical protein Y1Q_0004434 [Alligator mississippiensis]